MLTWKEAITGVVVYVTGRFFCDVFALDTSGTYLTAFLLSGLFYTLRPSARRLTE